MGHNQSLSAEELAFATASSTFSEKDLKRLHRRFRNLDIDNSGNLTLNEFLAVPGLENNPLVKRVMQIFDSDDSGAVDFKEFIMALSIFAHAEHRSEKLHFAFKIYDVNNDGFISNGDLFNMLKTMVGDNLEDIQLQQLVDRTIMQGDGDHDGKLSFDEFSQLVAGSDIQNKLRLNMSS